MNRQESLDFLNQCIEKIRNMSQEEFNQRDLEMEQRSTELSNALCVDFEVSLPINKQCLKQTTIAIIMKDKKFISKGTNAVYSSIHECPREALQCKTGEGYEMCKRICHQKFHAEEEAIKIAGDAATGATLYLIGHTHACDTCLTLMKNAGIIKLIICDTGEQILL